MTPDTPPTLSVSEMKTFIEDFFGRIRRVREAGQAEYAHTSENVFGNFDRIAAALGLTREAVMMTYALKHVDGIVAHVRGHRSQREDVSGRIEDLVMYLLLLAASEDARTAREVGLDSLEEPEAPEDRETGRGTPDTRITASSPPLSALATEQDWLEGYLTWKSSAALRRLKDDEARDITLSDEEAPPTAFMPMSYDWCHLCERIHLDPCDGDDELHAADARRAELLRADDPEAHARRRRRRRL